MLVSSCIRLTVVCGSACAAACARVILVARLAVVERMRAHVGSSTQVLLTRACAHMGTFADSCVGAHVCVCVGACVGACAFTCASTCAYIGDVVGAPLPPREWRERGKRKNRGSGLREGGGEGGLCVGGWG